ncbi:UNVERIFIED_CONTAM: hypothetical protein FKN15_017553 [Acipenser sinensis]
MEGNYWGEDDRDKKRQVEKKLREEFQLLTEEVGAARCRPMGRSWATRGRAVVAAGAHGDRNEDADPRLPQ